MKKFLKQILKQAKKTKARILFPEVEDIRILEALKIILKLKICQPVVPYEKNKFKKLARENGIKLRWRKISYLDSTNLRLLKTFSETLRKTRRKDHLTELDAFKLAATPHYFACLALLHNHADGVVTGSASTTPSTLIPALKLLRINPHLKEVSSTFLLIFPKQVLFFADCAVNIDPSPAELADIGINTARLAEKYGFEPKVAFLSYSTKGSGQGDRVEKIQKAVAIARKKAPRLKLDGELQVDAALVPEVAKIKNPRLKSSSKIVGDANVLIFPDLESGNIAYKLVERLGGALAVGGILTGLKKPYNDLSRGCSIDDIIFLTALTALETKL